MHMFVVLMLDEIGLALRSFLTISTDSNDTEGNRTMYRWSVVVHIFNSVRAVVRPVRDLARYSFKINLLVYS